jgi:hypothetical protein
MIDHYGKRRREEGEGESINHFWFLVGGVWLGCTMRAVEPELLVYTYGGCSHHRFSS